MLRVLLLYSNPLSLDRLRLDKEDKIVSHLARNYAQEVHLERLHASEIEDIHILLSSHEYDVIQFSGHGSPDGIYLDKSDMANDGELVSAKRLTSLLAMPQKPPRLVIILSCYSSKNREILAAAAPFVITAIGDVSDAVCLEFVSGFYERLFSGSPIKLAFDHAINLLNAKNIDCSNFCLDRRRLISKSNSIFIESAPDNQHDTILVNLDKVSEYLDNFDIEREELLHLISRKLLIHRWIFDIPRERCVIPIGRLLFGEFSWEDKNDIVFCNKLMKLRADVSPIHWELWHKLLISYNDLASSDYRKLTRPSSPENKTSLIRAANLFNHYTKKYLNPALNELESLGYSHLIPYIKFISTHCETAIDQLKLERYPQVVKALEEALTNYHDLVDGLTPPKVCD